MDPTLFARLEAEREEITKVTKDYNDREDFVLAITILH